MEPLGRPENAPHIRQQMANCLRMIGMHDLLKDYRKRNGMIYNALSLAALLGYPHGIQIDVQEPDWPVAFIELPTGQVSWHLEMYPGVWDEHDTEEKWERVRNYVDQYQGEDDAQPT